MTEFKVTRTYTVQLDESELEHVRNWAEQVEVKADRVIQDAVEAATVLSDGGDYFGKLHLYLQDQSDMSSFWWSDTHVGAHAPIMSISYTVDEFEV